jgi:trehalose synthase-fused probable maltokinase
VTRPEPDGGAGIRSTLPSVAARLPGFLPAQRWYGGKERTVERVEIRDTAIVPDHPTTLLTIVDVYTGERDAASYFVPLGFADPAQPDGPGEIVAWHGDLVVRDAIGDPDTCRALLRGMLGGRSLPTARGGRFVFHPAAAPRAAADLPHDEAALAALAVRHVGVEQSNSSVIFGSSFILKALRRLAAGVNPEIEIPLFLGQHTTFDRVPALVGWAEYRAPDGTSAPVAVLQRFVPNEGDGWSYVLRRVADERPSPPSALSRTRRGELPVPDLPLSRGRDVGAADVRAAQRRGSGGEGHLSDEIAALGRTLADLHLALASRPDVPEFAPEPIGRTDLKIWQQRTRASLDDVLARVKHGIGGELGATVLAGADRLHAAINGIMALADGVTVKTRHHGDFHLGQTLFAPDGWIIIDFEGEPLRSLDQRRAKQTPLRDLAGLLRSLDYAQATAERTSTSANAAHRAPSGSGLARLFEQCRAALLEAYVSTVRAGGAPLLPADPEALKQVLLALETEKALYELTYELGNRPDWVSIPLAALARLARAP